MALPANKTKIVATIGPASELPEVMEEMIRAGMNVARLNFSHGDFESHGEVIAKLRAASQAAERRLTIMADLPGPKMRIGQLAQEPIELEAGDSFTLTTEDIIGDQERVSMTFDRLPQAVKSGDTLYLNDGLIQLEVESVAGKDVKCKVLVGGALWSRKGLNLPTDRQCRQVCPAKQQSQNLDGLTSVSPPYSTVTGDRHGAQTYLQM